MNEDAALKQRPRRPAHARSVERHGMAVRVVGRGFLRDALPARDLLHLGDS
jgi:hypothetical protein